MNSDVYRDAFLAFVKGGMTYAEAMEQFDKAEWIKAMNEEIDSGEARRCFDPSVPLILQPDHNGKPSLLDLAAMAGFEARSAVGSDDMNQAMDLWQAGWTSEVPNPSNSKEFWRQCPVMSWYWRRPSRRPGKPGHRYLSTNQAWRAMKREQQ